MGGFASSRILEIHGERMIKRTFEPGFRIELHQKDLSLALQGARALSLSLLNTATTQELFNAAAALNGKGWDIRDWCGCSSAWPATQSRSSGSPAPPEGEGAWWALEESELS